MRVRRGVRSCPDSAAYAAARRQCSPRGHARDAPRVARFASRSTRFAGTRIAQRSRLGEHRRRARRSARVAWAPVSASRVRRWQRTSQTIRCREPTQSSLMLQPMGLGCSGDKRPGCSTAGSLSGPGTHRRWVGREAKRAARIAERACPRGAPRSQRAATARISFGASALIWRHCVSLAIDILIEPVQLPVQ